MWIEPVTDRTRADIINRTAKAFMNVADWNRIYGNEQEIKTLLLDLFGVDVELHTQYQADTATWLPIADPEITEFPHVNRVNALIDNINRLRVAANLPVVIPVLKADYVAGAGAVAPDYVAVNAWERNLELLYHALLRTAAYFVRCGVAATGQPRYWQARFRG